ncbi:hypothetical protein [Streptomyces sp. NBC_01304]|uniref:hypothetical protein n=1 Tax=Streptomyces sp. NBC_01304 TaxID=2903818 RepID=UPI002E1142EE|nr:hypothetical protein OG430_17475 [Streptomyces sp. NBC_01304]
MSTRRRTLVRIAAVSAVSGALLMPAAAAFADSPAPAPSASVTTPAKDIKGDKGDKAKGEKKHGKGVATAEKTPRGGVKAGAEGVTSGDNPALLAAGGGMAAAGAAGLGFAMLRRGRTDS